MPTALAYNNNLLKLNNYVIGSGSTPVPPGPVLPSNTVRVRTSDGQPPSIDEAAPARYETATLVSGTTDVYDVYKSGTDFFGLLCCSYNVVEVLGANTTGITNMQSMFYYCSSLTTVPLFDTSSVTDMTTMFRSCSSLTAIPLFNTSSVTSMNNMCRDCSNVESGALALYNQASSQTTPPSNHSFTFRNCGKDTVTGAAELAQIPSTWGGTGS